MECTNILKPLQIPRIFPFLHNILTKLKILHNILLLTMISSFLMVWSVRGDFKVLWKGSSSGVSSNSSFTRQLSDIFLVSFALPLGRPLPRPRSRGRPGGLPRPRPRLLPVNIMFSFYIVCYSKNVNYSVINRGGVL